MTPGRYRKILCDSDRINSINLGSFPVNLANSAADVEGFISESLAKRSSDFEIIF